MTIQAFSTASRVITEPVYDDATAAVVTALSAGAVDTVLDLLNRERVVCWRCLQGQVTGCALVRIPCPPLQVGGFTARMYQWVVAALLCRACCFATDDDELYATCVRVLPIFSRLRVARPTTTAPAHCIGVEFI